MANMKHIGWALAVAVGVGMAVASTPSVAWADSGKGPSSGESSHSSHPLSGKKIVPKPHRRAPKPANGPKRSPVTKVSALQVRSTAAAPPSNAAKPADPDFITSTHRFFGVFSVTSAADPDDNHYVAFVLRTPLFTNVLTSGTDPEDNLGFGAASVGVAGHTVNTFSSPLVNFSIGVPVEDPFAKLFTSFVRAGL